MAKNINCKKCSGTGWYQYTNYGTPHSTVCHECCDHTGGFWLLEKHYGENNGKLCCIAGCGFTKENIMTDSQKLNDIEIGISDLYNMMYELTDCLTKFVVCVTMPVLVTNNEAINKRKTKMAKGKAHPGFKAVEKKIAKKEGVSKKAAGAILAKSTRGASKAAKKANPALKKVKG